MEDKDRDISAVWALMRALTVLCVELDKANVMPRSTIAQALQADYLQEMERGRSEDFLAAYRSIAVQIGPAAGVPPS